MAEKNNGDGSSAAKPAVTKLEAVGRAMQMAGDDAELELLRKIVKDEFGLDLTVKHISANRGKIRSQQAKEEASASAEQPAPASAAPAPPPAAPEAQAANGEEGAAAKPQGKAKPKMTKKEAVRRALAKLGMDATPTELQTVIRRFGIDMTNDHISTTKGDIRREMAAKAEAASAVHAKPAVDAASLPIAAPAAKVAAAGDSGFGLGDIQAAKALVGRIGVEKLKGLIDVLAK